MPATGKDSDRRSRVITVLVGTVITLAVAGCSKPAQPAAETVNFARPPVVAPPGPSPAPKTGDAAPRPGVPSTATGVPSPAELAETYLATPDINERVRLITELAEAEPAAAVPSLRKLFHKETDTQLKQAMLDSLQDIDGAVGGKLEILREAVRPDQPRDVRQSAIDALTVLGDPRALPLLTPLLSDLDDEVREAANDAVEMLQTPR